VTDFEKSVRADFARSGLTGAEIKALQARPLSAKSASEFTGVKDGRPAVLFPTFDSDGKPIPGHGAVRYFDDVKPRTFEGAPLDGAKYRLPKDSAVRVSFTPRIGNPKPWRETIADPSEQVVIVEGQKKAMRLAREGYNVIALHGVTMFSAKKNGRKLIDDLAQIKWEGREVLIVFDSDADGNPDVVAAERRLAGVLRQFRARVAIVRLTPAKNGDRRGADDFLEQESAEALAELITKSRSGKATDLLENHALVLSPHAIVEMAADRDTVVPFHVFKQSLAQQFNERVPGPNGAPVVIKNFELWLEDERRKRYEKLDFVPGPDYPDVEVAGIGPCRNTWRGWPVKPEPGDCKPWLELHDRIYTGKPAWMRTYSLDWYSHLIQYPGEKCNVVQVITGLPGIGKDMLPEFLGEAFGRHFKQIDASTLKSSFTEYLEDLLLLNAMEVSAPDRRADADLYKSMVTRKTNTVNIKYGVKYEQRNLVRQILTSNHCDAVFATDDERRFFGVESKAPEMTAEEIARMLRWRNAENGPAHLLYYFLKRKIGDGFNATSPAPKTVDFYEIVEANRSPLETFVKSILDDPYGELVKDPYSQAKGAARVENRDVYSIKELLGFMKDAQTHSEKALGNAFRNTRRTARPNNKDGQVRLRDRSVSPRLWAITNIDFWKKASPRQWAHEYGRAHGLEKSIEKLYPPPKTEEEKKAA